MSKLTQELFLNSQNVEFHIERAQEIKGHTYEIIVRIGNLERFVYRRFNCIYDFNHSLAALLPQIQLPYFPSKFRVINKVETRKEKLAGYFNKLIEISNQKAFEDIGQTIDIIMVENQQKQEQEYIIMGIGQQPNQLHEQFRQRANELIRTNIQTCDEATINKQESEYISIRLQNLKQIVQKIEISSNFDSQKLANMTQQILQQQDQIKSALIRLTKKIKVEQFVQSGAIQKAQILQQIDQLINGCNILVSDIMQASNQLNLLEEFNQTNQQHQLKFVELNQQLEEKDIKYNQLIQEIKQLKDITAQEIIQKHEILIEQIAYQQQLDKRDIQDFIRNYFESFQSSLEQKQNVSQVLNQFEQNLTNADAKEFCQHFNLTNKLAISWDEFCQNLVYYLTKIKINQPKFQVYQIDKSLLIILKQSLIKLSDTNMINLEEINEFFEVYVTDERKIKQIQKLQSEMNLKFQLTQNYQGKLLFMTVVKIPIDQDVYNRTKQEQQRNTGIPVNSQYIIYPHGYLESKRYCNDYSVKIGRSCPDPDIENDIWFLATEFAVSRKQIEIRYQKEQDGWYIIDQGSINGTLIKIGQAMPLKLKSSQYINIGDIFTMSIDQIFEGTNKKEKPQFPYIEFCQTHMLQRQGLQHLNMYKQNENINFDRIQDPESIRTLQSQQKTLQSEQFQQDLNQKPGRSTPPGQNSQAFQFIAKVADHFNDQETIKTSVNQVEGEKQGKPFIKLSFYLNNKLEFERTLYAENQDNTQTFIIGRPNTNAPPVIVLDD